MPSGQFHGSSFNIAAMGVRAFIAGAISLRLSALLAAVVVVWLLLSERTVGTAESALLITMTGLTWEASIQLAWFRSW